MSDSSVFTPETPSTGSGSEVPEYAEDEQQNAKAKAKQSQQSKPWYPGSNVDSQGLVRSPKPPRPKPISACLVDPFETLPIEVDEVTNQLLHFYGQNSYWQTAYALSPKIKPSIKGSWEYQAGACLTHFHVLMARSALHQLRMNKYATATTRKHLSYAALKHQTQAVTVLRENVSLGAEADRKLILTSIISLATFEQRYGEPERAALHFKAARDIIRQIGFQDGLNDRLREEQALWFEGIYRDPEASFLWGKEDANTRLTWLKSLLQEVDRIWRDRQFLAHKDKGPFVAEGTRLHDFLFRDTGGRSVSVYGDIDEAVAQQRCLLIVVAIVTGLYDQLDGKSHVKALPKALAITGAIHAYAAFIEDMLVEHDLGGAAGGVGGNNGNGESPAAAVADLLWIMCQNYRDVKPAPTVAPASRLALQRLDWQDCHWRACGIANVSKYLPESRQSSLRNTLLAFVAGKPYTGKLKFNQFEFSYAGA